MSKALPHLPAKACFQISISVNKGCCRSLISENYQRLIYLKLSNMHSFFLPGPFFKSIVGLTFLGALLAFWLCPQASWAHPGAQANGFNLAEPAVVRYIYFEDADPAYAKSAGDLAQELSLSGAAWKAQGVAGTWNRTGIFLGSVAVLGKYMQPDEVVALTSMENDGYWLHLRQNAGYVAVRSAAALNPASAALRFALGFRYYLPNRNWEYYPRLTTLPDLSQGPPKALMANRGMFYGYGAGSKKLEEETTRWKLNNGLAIDNAVSTGHSWPGFYSRHKAEFAAHPEWFAAASDGSRRVVPANATSAQMQSVSFCVTNKKLIAALQADAIQRLQTQNMYSLDPSDGMDEKAVCQCESCQRLGSVSNIVFYLANQVAEAVGKTFPYKPGRGLEFNKMVGMYAYAQHALPPDFPVHQNVFVLVATAYNHSPLSYDELFERWGGKARGRWGIRDYWGGDAVGRRSARTIKAQSAGLRSRTAQICSTGCRSYQFRNHCRLDVPRYRPVHGSYSTARRQPKRRGANRGVLHPHVWSGSACAQAYVYGLANPGVGNAS
ncbi:DUF4838 domain-containing protein [Hymenobacter sp. J193]|uniref:DUF4838 domain-containing protein n=1 Tax=Hymenobacter sp. J193 TaxID=2898429 RepID=UPI002151864A|nr:DUF4838 domain-containing protein [Hymenobacter sp. J193]MCR5886787.1 DUF4838 domain-containing protein [Hymenobacter sp. J193]